MGLFTFNFEITLILAILAEDPADLKTPFVESCRPEAKQDFVGTFDLVIPNEFGELKSLFLGFMDPIFEITAINTCACFEDSYSHLDGPVGYTRLWDMLQYLSVGDINSAGVIMQPLYESSEQVQAAFQYQTEVGSRDLLICISDRMQKGGYLGNLFAAKIGFIRY